MTFEAGIVWGWALGLLVLLVVLLALDDRRGR